MRNTQNHILVIFGASGDLTKRKLLPSIFHLYKQGYLPNNFAVLGIGRTELDDEGFRKNIAEAFKEYAVTDTDISEFLAVLHYFSMETGKVNAYETLHQYLEVLSGNYETGLNFLYYLATPPSLYKTVAEGLANCNLSRNDAANWRRIIVEKPFGYDLKTARQLNIDLLNYFEEDQIYRIDHYLGKETVQNLMVTRFSNGIFEPLWNRNYIHHIEITSAESIGVEKRGGYYNNSGALRDMVQNHLLQLVALVAMEPPSVNSSTAIRNETLKVFQSIRRFNEEDILSHAIRGQYTHSTFMGSELKGYREEEGVPKDSRTETYLALKLFIDNWRWGGVPFYIRTGKRLPTRVSEIVVHFKPTPHSLFCFSEHNLNHDNQLVIRIQPDEGILLKFGMKVPGAGFSVQDVNMDFHYSDLGDTDLPEAYTRLIYDCMMGDSTLYSRGDAVEEAWKIVDPILNYWQKNPDSELHGYPAGTWGPKTADVLIEGELKTWRYPCKNLTDDGVFCEL